MKEPNMAPAHADREKPGPHPAIAWLLRYRTSARLAFVMKTTSTLLGAVFSLGWTKLILHAMGKQLNGEFISFQGWANLGGLGDLGIGTGMSVRVLRHLSRKEDEACQRVLANARGVFLSMAIFSLFAGLILAPWLPRLLDYPESAAAGSLPLLFAVGSLGIALVIIGGYLQNLNYIHGSVVWPILPSFMFAQLGFAGQWLLARHGAPLWQQYGVYVCLSMCGCCLSWSMLRISHPWLGKLRPIQFDRREIRDLLGTSFWAYLISVGNYIYVATDRQLIGSGIGYEYVTAYTRNYRMPELAMTLIAAASFVGVPAMVSRLLSADEHERARGMHGVKRLQRFQVFAAGFVACSYLFFNDIFMVLWLGPDYMAPLSWQIAFALNLAITIGNDLGFQLLVRMDREGIRTGGICIVLAGFLNLGLSLLAMHAKWIPGIALATVVSQTVVSFVIRRKACAALGVTWQAWLVQTWALPVLIVLAASGIRWLVAPDNFVHLAELMGLLGGLSLVLARGLGITPAMVREELNRLGVGRAKAGG